MSAEKEVINIEREERMLDTPFPLIRSSLTTSTKLYDEKFICNQGSLENLYRKIAEKLNSLSPQKVDFQYVVSFRDNTHYQDRNLGFLEKTLKGNEKKTERLALTFGAIHEIEGKENNIQIVVRVSNEANPLFMLQAALSKSPEELDNLEKEMSNVVVTIVGSTQMYAEEMFNVIGSWLAGCPQPSSMTKINKFFSKHRRKIYFLNKWLAPLMLATLYSFILIETTDQKTLNSMIFIGIVGFIFLKDLVEIANNKISRWSSKSQNFSVFDLTGGDSNHQTEIIAQSTNSTFKLAASWLVSFVINVAAGITVIKLIY